LVEPGSVSFVVRDGFLLDFNESSLIHHFGRNPKVVIPRQVRCICQRTFYRS
jgi:hypothetical protein